MKAHLYLDNKPQQGIAGESFERRTPTGDKLATTVWGGRAEDARRAAESSAEAFKTWSAIGPGERRKVLLAAADNLEKKLPDITNAMASEIGASAMWSNVNVMAAAALIREAASLTTQASGETIPSDRPGVFSMTVRQPVGVVLSMAPWNGPIALGARSIAYPLALGNAVVFKGSELSPGTHSLLIEAFVEAGLPPGALNGIFSTPEAAPEILDELINHPAIKRINFTGSTNVGRIIAEKAGRVLKRCLLELGGKAPMIVLDDADVEAAVDAAIFGAFMYQGQICMSTERFILDESIADEFVENFKKKADRLVVADPILKPAAVVGPVIDARSVDRLQKLIENAVAKGAVVAAGGVPEGVLMRPTIIDRCTSDMDIYDQETFGPVTTVVRVKGAEEALRIANDTKYGLAASVFSRDAYRALQIGLGIDAGAIHINGATVQNEPQAPYGGMKASGYGRFDGRAVIDEFTELKWITVEPARQRYPI
jgi:acyl-CoA reductase-like NAD-dependent aldehyde dehydrogenase